MITLKPAVRRFPVRAASTAFAALLLLGLPLMAQRGGHSGGGGGSAHSTGGGSHSGGSHSGGSHSGGRTAHGTSGNSGGRQPGHGGFHGGHGFSRGGHFYYYPYGFGFGFWPGFYWDGWYGNPYYYGYYGGDGGYYDRGGDYDRSEMGALDLDVSPGRTHVFVNGEDLGIVDRYDGWPGYLWLPEGTYDIAFYLPGYKTIARQMTIYPGSVVDVDDRMEKGESIRPEDLVTKTHERRDERLRFEHQRQEQLDRQNGGGDDQDWRDRVRHDRMMKDKDDDQGGGDNQGDNRDNNRDNNRGDNRDNRGDDHGHAVRGDSAQSHLHLSVEPRDASVYLDGQFVGTGTDLSLLHAGLPVAPGSHKLAVVRPGRKAVERTFDVKSGGDVELEIALEAGSGR